jgi:hypothetical protein
MNLTHTSICLARTDIRFKYNIQCVPLAIEPGWLADRCSVSQTIRRTTYTFLFISHTTNVPLFKFRCNIFIGVRIIKEMPGSVASGTPCIYSAVFLIFYQTNSAKVKHQAHNFHIRTVQHLDIIKVFLSTNRCTNESS